MKKMFELPTRSQYFTRKRKLSESTSKLPSSIVQPISNLSPGEPKSKDTLTASRYGDHFFDMSCPELANNLLGKILVRKLDSGERLSGRIVETECYLGGEDKASHSFRGKQTPRNAPMFMKPGTVYVYMTYGMYYCCNISSKGEGAAVLLRALEPLEGLDRMKETRGLKRKNGVTSLKEKDLCSGPSKLCQAMQINKDLLNEQDLVTSNLMWLERGDDIKPSDIVTTSRIGIGPSAGEWMNKPLRFYIRGNIYVSVKDRKQEPSKRQGGGTNVNLPIL